MRAGHRVSAGLTLLVVAALAGWKSNEPERGECTTASDVGPVAVDTTTNLRLALNVPAYRLDVLQGGGVTRSIRVAIGQPKYRTPLGRFGIDYVVWNPWWHPPASEWARRERPKAPGWSNPVGRVKLHVHGLVFLHGTPSESSLGTPASHACVRMSNADAIALARLLHARAGPTLAPASLDSLVADTARTRTIVFARAVRIDIVYELAEVRDGELWLYPDVYGFAGARVASIEAQAIQALQRAGRDSAELRITRLRALADSAHRAAVRIPVDSLFPSPTMR